MNDRSALLLLLGLMLSSPASFAQNQDDTANDPENDATETPEEDTYTFGEILIRGEKIERSLQDTASSVAVYDRETIDEQKYTDIYDLMDQTANVATGFDDRLFSIRGMRNTGPGLGDTTSDVSTVYVDGVFLPSSLFSQGALNLWDVESVEIFRGPQSTIQGRNALAGAIVARTADPSYDFEGRAQLSYADYDTMRASAALSIPLIDNQAALRISADEARSDGFIENPTLGIDDSDPDDATTLRSKLLLTPDALPNLTARLAYTNLDSYDGEGRIETDFFPEERLNFENLQSSRAVDADISSLELDYSLGLNWSLTSISGYTDSETRFVIDDTRDETGGPAVNNYLTEEEVFSQELRATYQGDRVNALIGAYYFNRTGSTDNVSESLIGSDFAFPDPVTLAGLIFQTNAPTQQQIAQATGIRGQIVQQIPQFPVNFVRDSDIDIENYAVFGEVEYALNDKLSMTLGLRYDREDISQNVLDSTMVPPLSVGDPLIDQVLDAAATQFSNVITIDDVDNDFSALLPKAVLSYEWSDTLTTSFSVQRGYRAGGLSINLFRAALAPEGADQATLESQGVVNSFEPEFTNNYELSMRSRWLNDRLLVNANLFRIDYTDQQINTQLSSNPLDTLTDNVGESELHGFELEMAAYLARGLEVNANLGYTDTEFTDGGGVLDDVIGGGIDLTGKEFSYAPQWTAGGAVRYSWGSGWFVNVRANYADSAFTTPENNPLAVNDSRTVVNLLAGYDAGRYRVEAFADNLFDEDYYAFRPAPPVEGAVAIAGHPRVVGARVLFDF